MFYKLFQVRLKKVRESGLFKSGVYSLLGLFSFGGILMASGLGKNLNFNSLSPLIFEKAVTLAEELVGGSSASLLNSGNQKQTTNTSSPTAQLEEDDFGPASLTDFPAGSFIIDMGQVSTDRATLIQQTVEAIRFNF